MKLSQINGSRFNKIMKLTSFFLLINLSALTAIGTYSQDVKLNIKMNNVGITEVINEIQSSSDFVFLYNNEQVSYIDDINVEVENATIDEILYSVLKDTNIGYKIVDKIIVLSPKLPLNNKSNSSPVKSFQEKTIKGLVTDETGTPMPGVTVIIKDTQKGVSTGVDGTFEISIPEGEVILEFSYVGYQKQEILLTSGQSSMDVMMRPDITSLSEVIVVAYNEQTKVSFTGSASAIDLQSIEKSPKESFQQSLQGTVAGVFSQSPSGQPGSAPAIRIRGIGSINASNAPLYVVDGVPLSNYEMTSLATSSNTLAGLNSNDIATITILKDASATSIYGSRGANGVILITTKHGKSGKTKFDVDIQHGVSTMLFNDSYKPLNTDELTELLVEARVNNGDTYEDAQDYINSNIDASISTDWVDVITRPGKYSQYNVSASGGNDNTTFYSSLGYYDQEGTVIGVDYKKLNGKLNLRNNISDKFVIDLGLSLSHQILHTNSDAGNAANPMRAIYRTVPWVTVYNDDGTYNTGFLLTYNPVGLVNENIRETKLYGVLGNVGLKWYLLEGLSFESRVNAELNFSNEFRYDNPYFGEGRNDGGRGRAWAKNILNWNFTNLLKYNTELGDDHSIGFTIGYEAQKITSDESFAYAINYGTPDLYTLANAAVPYDAYSARTGSAIESFLASVNYNYSDKYYFNITGRRDGSSRFGKKVRYANFGSVGISWNITEEPFFESVNFLNEFRLRASYGVNGNQDGIGDFESRGLYTTGEDYMGEPGYTYYQQSNPYLTWEKNIPFNVGLDFDIFDRVSGTIEYYNRVTSDLLMNVPLSATNGLTSILDNRGKMKNEGIEFSISSQNTSPTSSFKWFTDFNITCNNNEITELPDDEPIVTTTFKRDVGTTYYTFYLVKYAGVNPDNGDALWYTDETETETTNDYSEAERALVGSSLPKFMGGLTNRFSYRGFSLSVLLYYNFGNKVYDYWERYIANDGSAKLNDRGNMARKIYEERWQEPGDITEVPKVVWGNTQSGSSSQHSTRFLYDGSYLRLRDLTLSYTFPQELIRKVKMDNASLYLRGSNLATYVKDKRLGTDPEVGVDGLTDLRIPASRQFLVGLNISF